MIQSNNVQMMQDLAIIRKLQDLDIRIAELEAEIAILPKHIAEIERTLESHKRRLEMDQSALSGNQKERRRLEDEIKVHEQKMSKLKDQMMSAKTNEQYRAFQHEIDFCQNEIRKYEDRILDLMSESEPLEQNVKKAEASLRDEAVQVESEKEAARERTASIQKQAAELKQARSIAASGLRQDYMGVYERLRRRSNGIAVAEAVEGRCSGCHISLRPQLLQELRTGLEGLKHCDNCKRILYENPPVSFQEQTV